MNKKGGVFDIFLAIILSFILVVICVIFTFSAATVHNKLDEVAPQLQASLGNGTNVSKIIDQSMGDIDNAYANFKWICVMLIFGYFLCVILSAYLVKTHPAWFIAYLLIVILAIIMSIYISNTYETLYQTAILQNTWFAFTGANFIFLYLPIWVTIISFIAAILMFINMDSGVQY